MFDLNIVIVNYHNKDDVAKVIGSILFDLASSNLKAHIAVVDNSQNQDGVKAVLSQFGEQVRYVDAKRNIGYGRACNLGFKSVPARYYFICNPDNIILPQSKTFERLIRFLEQNLQVGAVGPKLVYPSGALQYTCCRFDRPSILIKPLKQMGWHNKYEWIAKHADRLLMKDFEHDKTQPVDWVIGSAIMIRGDALDKIRGFDERYFMYLEDCDLCQGLWENGFPVYYMHDVIVEHRYTRESAEVPGIFSALIKNRLARAHFFSWIKYLWKWRKLHKYYA